MSKWSKVNQPISFGASHVNMSLLSRFQKYLLIIGIFSIFNGIAAQVQEKELMVLEEVQSHLNLQREWIQYRYDSKVKECSSLFWVQRCIDKARVQLLKESKVVRDQEIALHDRQRMVNEALKDEKDQLRIAEYQDPKKVQERADNRAAYEEKQRLRAERAEALEERRKDAAKRANENRQTSPLD